MIAYQELYPTGNYYDQSIWRVQKVLQSSDTLLAPTVWGFAADNTEVPFMHFCHVGFSVVVQYMSSGLPQFFTLSELNDSSTGEKQLDIRAKLSLVASRAVVCFLCSNRQCQCHPPLSKTTIPPTHHPHRSISHQSTAALNTAQGIQTASTVENYPPSPQDMIKINADLWDQKTLLSGWMVI